MKTWLFILLLCLGTFNMAFATPSRWRDGKIEFAVSTVGGAPAFSTAEQDALALANPAGQVVAQVTQGFEVNLSTCLIIYLDGNFVSGFANNTEFMQCQTKAGLKRKVMQLRDLIDAMSDLPASDSADFKSRAGWLKSYYQTLP